MEQQDLSEISPSTPTISHQSKEGETKKRAHFTAGVVSHPGISSGDNICLEGNVTVGDVQEMISSHESPRKKRNHCNSSDGATHFSPEDNYLCKESGSGVDESQSAVNDASTQADESSFTLKEESLPTCQTEIIDTIDMELKKPMIFTENDQEPITESCSSAGVLQNISDRTTLMSSTDEVSGSAECMTGIDRQHDFPKYAHPVQILKESLCDDNVSKVTNATDDVPAPVKAETIQSTACCQEEKSSGCPSSINQSYLCSEQRNVEAARHCRKKLLILDVNGLLADIVAYPERQYMPDAWISMKAVFKRPFCTDFLEFCFENFEVGVWSSRNRKNVDSAVDFLMGDKKKKLIFCWDQSHCTDTGYRTVEDRNKPLFLKEIKKLWDKEDPSLPWEKGDYNESNTILMDDSPHKALRNPPYTGVFPYPYLYKDNRDNLLARKGKLRLYLERLVKADNVQKFVSENRFGQRPITKSDVSWPYYSKIFYAAGSTKPENNKVINDREGEQINDDKQKPHSEASISTSEVATCVAIAEKPSN
ncbi:hypothetical protein V2J09_019438 [Rumex salicifolius]